MSVPMSPTQTKVFELSQGYPTSMIATNFLFQKGEKLKFSNFSGSFNAIEIISSSSIAIESPACFAAPRVTLIAGKKIKLGLTKPEDRFPPARIYAPEHLTITTGHLLIGNIVPIISKGNVCVSCTKLTIKGNVIPEAVVQTFKSWLLDSGTEICLDEGEEIE